MELPLSTFPRPFGLSPVGGGESQLQAQVKVVVYCSDLLTSGLKTEGNRLATFLNYVSIGYRPTCAHLIL